MIGILFGILKVLALILLGILGLILLLVVLVLLVPIRYYAEGSYHGRPEGTAGVTWFWRLIHVTAEYHEGAVLQLKLCGFRVFSTREDEEGKKKDKSKKAKKKSKNRKKSGRKSGKKIEKETEKEAEKEVKPEAEIKAKAEAKAEAKAKAKAEAVPKSSKEVTEEIKPEAKSPFPFTKIYDKLVNIRKKKDTVTAFIQDEANRRTLALLKRQAIRLLRHIFIRRVSGRIRFGFDDPYTTGQILTWISPFYSLYAGKLELIPVFEEKILDGELSLSGRVRLGTVLILAVRILLDRNFRRLLRKLLSRN